MKPLFPFLLALTCALTVPAAAQKTYSLVGQWRADVFEFGESVSIYWNVYADGTTAYNFVRAGGSSGWMSGGWAYSDNVVYECWSDGECGWGSVAWVSRDCFVITIGHNQASPLMDGWKRVYRRVGYP